MKTTTRGKEIRIVRIVFAEIDEATPEERARVETAQRRLDADVTRILGRMVQNDLRGPADAGSGNAPVNESRPEARPLSPRPQPTRADGSAVERPTSAATAL